MATGFPSHLRFASAVRGPLRPAQFHELAEGGAISPATEAAMSADGPWSRLETWPCHAELFPARPTLTFKNTEFEKVNRDTTPPVDHRELIAWANLEPPANGPKSSGPTRAPKPEPATANEVLDIVREVVRVEQKFAKPMVFPSRRQVSRRFLHYLVLAVIGNGMMAGIALYYSPIDEMSTMILGGWAALFNLGLAVIMLLMVPRY